MKHKEIRNEKIRDDLNANKSHDGLGTENREKNMIMDSNRIVKKKQ